MHLIDITNTYKDLVAKQLATTSSEYIKVYSLGTTTVLYSETTKKIEIVMENHDRPISQDEVNFVLNRLIKGDPIYNITIENSRKVISITCDK